MEGIITDMHGNSYTIRNWRVLLQFPKYIEYKHRHYGRDTSNNQTAVFILSKKDKWYMAKLTTYKVWILYKLKFLDYDELKDIRKSYLHGNIYHA